MDAIGGLVGITQDRETLALRPKVGWAVREAEKMDVCLTKLSKDHNTFPGVQNDDMRSFPAGPGQLVLAEIPPDLSKFYNLLTPIHTRRIE